MYDALIEVITYGICSPYNSHSYRGSLILLPCLCSACNKTMYPLVTSTVTCIRCHSVSHRGLCMRSSKSYCPAVNRRNGVNGTCKGQEKSLTFGNQPHGVQKSTTSNASSMSDEHELLTEVPQLMDTRDEISIEPAAKKIISASIPLPGSADCIWRKELHLLADQQSRVVKYKDIPLLLNTKFTDDELSIALDSFVETALGDVSTFPGHVCSVLHSLYLNKRFCSDRNTLLHARECLDVIICAVLSVLPADIINENSSSSEIISGAVDRNVLALSHGAMYCKAFLAAQLLAAENDQKFSMASLKEVNRYNDNLNVLSCRATEVCCYCDFVKPIMSYTSELLSPRDKLSQLKKALQAISNSVHKHTCTVGAGVSLDPKIEYDGEIKLSHDSEEFLTASALSSFDTDTLIEVVSNVLLALNNPNSDVALETATTCWFAECIYIDAMMREGDWALGIESYALTTVMQSLQSIIQSFNSTNEASSYH